MEEQTKELLYNLACGIIELINENERLERENKNLTAYKERRAEMDTKYLQKQMDVFNDMFLQKKTKKYRIWFKHDGGMRMDKIDEVCDSEFDANERCFWLNDNAPMSSFGQYVYEEEEEEDEE